MNCRHCGAELQLPLLDLGAAPPSNSYLLRSRLYAAEISYPLRLLVCEQCWLVQTEDYAGRDELFPADYAYFSSVSASWLVHARHYVEKMVGRFHLSSDSHVVEIAANDGYLLQYFKERGIPCLGVEPTTDTANAARRKGIEIVEEFFGIDLGMRLAAEGRQADLMAANNVLAHVPDINDFVGGFVRLLKPEGITTFEFPHLVRMVEQGLFDTAYHEHFSYLSLTAVQRIFAKNGLRVIDVDELPTHGGSLRVYAARADNKSAEEASNVRRVLDEEERLGIRTREFYGLLQRKAERVKDDLLAYLIKAKRSGLRIAAYGAAAKGNTLLNFAGIRPDLISFVADRNPAKQDKFTPGTRIPIVAEDRLRTDKPDLVVLLPWNLKRELTEQLSYIKEWKGRFVTAVPELVVEAAGSTP